MSSTDIPTHADGLVLLGTTIHLVRVPRVLTILDVPSWFAASRERDLAYAARIEADPECTGPDPVGTAECAAMMRAETAEAERLLRRGAWIEGADVWPQTEFRCRVPEWRVTDEAEARRYARRLKAQDLGGAELASVEWSYHQDPGGWRLDALERLGKSARHTRSFVRGRVVEAIDASAYRWQFWRIGTEVALLIDPPHAQREGLVGGARLGTPAFAGPTPKTAPSDAQARRASPNGDAAVGSGAAPLSPAEAEQVVVADARRVGGESDDGEPPVIHHPLHRAEADGEQRGGLVERDEDRVLERLLFHKSPFAAGGETSCMDIEPSSAGAGKPLSANLKRPTRAGNTLSTQ